MAKAKGRDGTARQKSAKRGRRYRTRHVYIFTEGKVTEVEYIDLILEHGTWHDPERRVDHHFENDTVESKYRKPLPMVRAAVSVLRRVEREAKAAGLDKERDWNWPQVWVLFDRDEHPGIAEARKLARQSGVKVAYSHPCFELWRLLHYRNYTSTFGGVCGNANCGSRPTSLRPTART
ncbi:MULTISPECIES: RloB family protein [Streptomyces]|uniref:RloB domain-containing protein n=1 Tax=Streptomyces xinghaiensis TaxID=1038928 RepID=A0A3R7H7A9_9ACTN|nr:MULTISPECIES: RloB family protein [Streptomyces]PQM20399.1 RloB domain-containing protein [Streptomyces xinghaiensis]RKM91209.1 RloB domain-containing protein [Streptomyces xinghaiensis]RNC69702.1 RloB domain-containing protein [Streptomyces xinghaiensis]